MGAQEASPDPHVPHGLGPAELAAFLTARGRGGALLTWKDDGNALKILELDPLRRYSVGRRPTMDVVLQWDTRVSKLHSELECVGGEWMLTDGISKNGTLVAGRRVQGRTRLRDGDRVVVGNCTLVFHEGDGPEITTTQDGGLEEVLARFDDVDREILVALCRPYMTRGVIEPASNEEICREVHFTDDGVKARFTRIYRKAEIETGASRKHRGELMRFAIDVGLVGPQDYETPAR